MLGLGEATKMQEVLGGIAESGDELLSHLKSLLNNPEYHRVHRTYRITEMFELTGLPRTTWKKYVAEGKIILPGLDLKDEDRREYTLTEIDSIRQQTKRGFFDKYQGFERNALVVAVAMFKGGVGKTTTSTHLAAKAAIAGLKTLLIDLDYQASATLAFGFVPGFDIAADLNIYEALMQDPREIRSAVKGTHIYNLDLIPASLSLSGANVELLNPQINRQDELGNPLGRLKQAIEVIRGEYDLIVLDCPPNFEAVAMNGLYASDGIVLPITPNMLSLSSAVSFCRTVSDLYGILGNKQIDVGNKLFKVLITNDPQNSESERIVGVIRSLLGPYLMKHAMPRTIALDRASNDLSILYDLRKSDIRGDRKAFDRALTSMDLINDEILTSLKAVWGLE